MQIDSFLADDAVFIDLEASSYKKALESIASAVADRHPDAQRRALLKALLERERLGSTAVGGGVAIPHCRVDGVDSIVGVFVRLTNPINYDAPDDQPVDLLFALVVPADCVDGHLQALAAISEKLSLSSLREQLRLGNDAKQVYNLLT